MGGVISLSHACFAEPPMNKLNITPNNPIEGQVVHIVCESTGNPPPSIFWVKKEMNESAVLNTARISVTTTPTEFSINQRPMTTSNVTISSTIPSDGGVYTCLANNSNTPTVIVERMILNITGKYITQ